MVDLAARTDRLDAYLAERGLEAVWFARPNGFAWLTGGDNVVDADAATGVAAAGYDGELRVIADDIEADRLADEELPDAFAVESFPWYADSLAAAVAERSPEPAAADFDVSGFEAVDGSRLRQPLTDDDVERYRELGREVAAAVETVCRNLEPDDPEYEVAAGIDISLASRDVDTPVVLVGGAERAQAFRHYTPSDAALGDYALVSVTAERAGLYASMTRTVAFDAPDWFEERHRAAARVEATAIRATEAAAAGTLVGGDGDAGSADAPDAAGDVFEAIREAYDAVGFADEWEKHHQGGAAGFAGREWIATPDGDEPVRWPMGYAWNPTVRGTKSEDTHLVAPDLTERLTKTGRWPTHETEPVDVAGIDAEPVELAAPVIR
ncbi:peptidase [Halorubrum ezzemoulense]|uniref:Peptidase n=1 Tax=Halorubrum ezzemoulense TaxID=337243 RepID=A0A256K905_HALEZ|nr:MULTISPECIES: M24 family metallopeptidase [Halorubrum]OYR61217.1 peptidase [Halorubrum ezzemoulense]OYR77634.1 peptidase [Halorubrum ezzemoulense]OYR79253.1 peptidase [Halorubrum ezzemoulense]PHQ41607.1 peptidase [Halorubrum sp. C191]QAY20372.1 M24 family metallopeptidase [Halorubrum ezzemoulense]